MYVWGHCLNVSTLFIYVTAMVDSMVSRIGPIATFPLLRRCFFSIPVTAMVYSMVSRIDPIAPFLLQVDHF